MPIAYSRFHIHIGYIIGVSFCILLGGFYLLNSVPVAKHDQVATALLVDITVTFPITYYFLLIRPFKLRKHRLILVFSCCCGIAYLILPAHQRQFILQLRKLTVLFELGVIIYAVSQLAKVRRLYKNLQSAIPDSAWHLRQSMIEVLGNKLAIRILAAELTVIRFGLLCWKRPRALPLNAKRFTTYRDTSYVALFSVVLFVCVIEMVAVHLVVWQYSYRAAAILSFFSACGVLFIVSDISGIVKSPVLIMNDQLLLRTGIRWRVKTDIHNVKAIQHVKENMLCEGLCFKDGVTKDSVNLLITFENPVCIERLYHKPIMSEKILTHIDQPAEFIEYVNVLTAANK